MAWQNSAGMGGSGGSPASGSEVAHSAGPSQGTEYTLQGTHDLAHHTLLGREFVSPFHGPSLTAARFKGVMRFLQTEWHRHERDRNAWQIERAEMKSRIGKLEGDLRMNKKLRESMDKHIRMLENVLRKKDAPKTKEIESGEEKGKEEGQEDKTSAKASPSSKCRYLQACTIAFADFTCSQPTQTPQLFPRPRER